MPYLATPDTGRRRFAANLKTILAAQDLSLWRLAQTLGCSERTTADWAAGKRAIDTNYLGLLAETLGVDVGLFLSSPVTVNQWVAAQPKRTANPKNRPTSRAKP